VFALIFMLALLAGPGSAEAPANRNEAALSLIPFDWHQLHYNIVFLAPRRGVRAMIFPSQHKIEVYARPADDSRQLAYDIAHELGHAIDMTFNTADSRKQWMEARGIDPKTQWFGCSRCSDFKTPAGDFAETFAFLLLGPGNFSGRIAPPPKAEQVSALKAFFAAELQVSPNPANGVETQPSAAKMAPEIAVLPDN
jgi:hypothetical protein